MSINVNIDVGKLAELVEERLKRDRKVASGYVEVTGDGSTTKFEVRVKHGLKSDKLVVSVSSTRTLSSPPSYLYGYLDDEDNDGFYETLVICVRFDTAPSSGEKVKIFWEAKIVEE